MSRHLLTYTSHHHYTRMLAKFTFDGGQYDSKPVTIDTSMTNADFSGKKLYTAGAIMLAAFLPKCR